jgi:putative addiction module killer protein
MKPSRDTSVASASRPTEQSEGPSAPVIEVQQSTTFKRWLQSLRDARARARIVARIDRMAEGNLGDVKPVAGGLSEMRIHYGPGYRVYFMQRGTALIILLCGGDKRDQTKSIESARRIAQDWLKAHP